MPDPRQPRNGCVVPLQLMAGASGKVSASKRQAIMSGKVAFVKLNRFLTQAEVDKTIEAAVHGNPDELWLLAEIIRGAIASFIGRNVRFPVEPESPYYDTSNPVVHRYRRLLRPDIRDHLSVVYDRAHGTRSARSRQVTERMRSLSQGTKPYMKDELYRRH